MALPLGKNIILKQKNGSNTDIFYPWTVVTNVYNADGTDLQTLLDGKAKTDHGNHVPATETANSLKFLRNDNKWAEIQSATTSQKGVVQLTDSTSTTSSTVAATATAVKAAYDKANHQHPYVPTANVGKANGVASLDETGKVPSTQLPSYVDDVIDCKTVTDTEATDSTGTKITPESGKIYIVVDATQTNVGSIYRWSGTKYVSIPNGMALGTTANTAFPGDKGQVAYEHSQAEHAMATATEVAKSTQNGYIKIKQKGGEFSETLVYTHPTVEGGSATNPHGTTKADVGLGNVENKNSATIRGEITKENVTKALGFTPANATTLATASQDGLMSKGYAAKLDGCMEVVIATEEPSKDCLWFHVQA